MKSAVIAFIDLILISASLGHEGLWALFFAGLAIAVIVMALVFRIDCFVTWGRSGLAAALCLMSLPLAVNSVGAWGFALISAALVLGALLLDAIRRADQRAGIMSHGGRWDA